jgi:flavin-dependent dehydrogenase
MSDTEYDMATTETIETDVLIIGAGPIGATFARYLSAANRRVLLIGAGAQHSRRPGEHLKNAFVYQRDLDRFTPIVQGLLNPLSVAPIVGERSVLDPIAFRTPVSSFRSAHNPKQDPTRNLDAAAASHIERQKIEQCP